MLLCWVSLMGNVSTVDVKYIMSRDGVKRDSFIDKLRYDNEERDDTQEKRYMYYMNLHIKQQIFVFVYERKMKYIKYFHHSEMTSHLSGLALWWVFYNVDKKKSDVKYLMSGREVNLIHLILDIVCDFITFLAPNKFDNCI